MRKAFVIMTVVVSLVLGSFMLTPGANKSVATTSKQSTGTAALSEFSPFFFAVSAPVVAAGTGPEAESVPGAPAGYSCKLMAQAPADWTAMKRRNIFDTTWVLKNTGTKVWGLHGVDVRYRGDTKMHYNVPDLFDIPKKVGPGQKIVLTLDMLAPKLPGYYVSNWGLYAGGQVFCKFYVIIVVSK